jgi:hypothetical protein
MVILHANISHMARSKNTTKSGDSSSIVTTTTNLPGLKNVEVIVSYPMILKENSSKPIIKK